jgi:tRNA threonylcarbamoyladenosine modification (KEOPS) complex  Pcc1 subunit
VNKLSHLNLLPSQHDVQHALSSFAWKSVNGRVHFLVELKGMAENQALDLKVHATDAKNFRAEINGKLSTLQTSLANTNQLVINALAKRA